jgi:hypothetical protein
LHSDDPGLLYNSGPHMEHPVAPAPEEDPAGHGVHADSALAPADDRYFPVEQSVQVCEFAVDEYLPAGQASHFPTEVPAHCTDQYFPAPHAAQSWQVPADVPLHPKRYWFTLHAPQSWQVPADVPLHPKRYLFKLHAPQLWQVPADVPLHPKRYWFTSHARQ